jgi:hypothetical protein
MPSMPPLHAARMMRRDFPLSECQTLPCAANPLTLAASIKLGVDSFPASRPHPASLLGAALA